MRAKTWIAFLPVFFPGIALADTQEAIVQAVNIFNIFAGGMFTVSVIIFLAGFVVWLVRLGTEFRSQGVVTMQWGVATLFVLDVLLAIVDFFEQHSQMGLYIVAFGVIILCMWILAASGLLGGGEKEEKHE